MDDEDQYDLSSEIEEERESNFLHKCAHRDMDHGIDPNPTNWDSNDDNE